MKEFRLGYKHTVQTLQTHTRNTNMCIYIYIERERARDSRVHEDMCLSCLFLYVYYKLFGVLVSGGRSSCRVAGVRSLYRLLLSRGPGSKMSGSLV